MTTISTLNFETTSHPQDIAEVNILATSVKQYRKGKYKTVELPSTLEDGSHPVFVIRKPPITAMVKIMDVLGLKIPSEVSPEDLEKTIEERRKALAKRLSTKDFVKVMEILLPACVVEPKISLEASDDALAVDELEFEDQIQLLDAVWKFSGLSKESEETRNL